MPPRPDKMSHQTIKMAVKIKNFLSIPFPVTSGVPQGSHLGPLLFILFVNDIHGYLNGVDFLMFADDLKLFKEITCRSDIVILQGAIENLSRWCRLNRLSLNINKCHSITFHRKTVSIPSSYSIDNFPLPKHSSVKDLGVIFDDRLSFDLHITHIVSKAYRSLGFVLRNTVDFRNPCSIKILYTSLVRPILEYCSPVWNPYHHSQIMSIEKIQHRMLRRFAFILKLPHFDYDSLSLFLGLSTLHSRRMVNDIFLVFKLINSIVDSPLLLSLIDFHVPSRPTRSSQLFHIRQCNTLYLQSATFPRILVSANSLSSEVDFFTEKEKRFKALAREHVHKVLGLVTT